MTSTNDEREALRDFADRMQEAAANCCIDPDAGPDAQTSISFTGEEGAKLAHALHSVLASLPAPTPAAGEAVALKWNEAAAAVTEGLTGDAFVLTRSEGLWTVRTLDAWRHLNAASQAPATGGDAVAVLRFANGLPGNENEMPTVVSCNWPPDGEYRVFLANHSPDAGDVGEGELWRHKKRGTVYKVIGEAELQCATHDPSEGDELVIYRGDDGKLWARMRDEFHDGRFEALHPDPRGEG